MDPRQGMTGIERLQAMYGDSQGLGFGNPNSVAGGLYDYNSTFESLRQMFMPFYYPPESYLAKRAREAGEKQKEVNRWMSDYAMKLMNEPPVPPARLTPSSLRTMSVEELRTI